MRAEVSQACFLDRCDALGNHSVTPSSELHNPRRGRVSRDTIRRGAVDRHFEVARVSVLRRSSKGTFKAIIDVVCSAAPRCADVIVRRPVNIHRR